MIYIYIYIISFSLIGYGFLISRFLEINKYSFGFLGLIGITFFGFFSFFSSLFTKHDYFFNSIFVMIGLLIFIFSIKKISSFKKELINFFIIFVFLFLLISVAKNHDDFPYYHFPYMILLTEYSHPIGLGLLNNGFRSPSSIFFISSMFYLPGIKFYLFHLTPALIMGFSNLLLLNLTLDKKIFYRNKFINFLSLLSLVFINIFFYRLAEHGTDRSGMIIIIISIIYLLHLLNNSYKNEKNENINYLKIIAIFICFAATIKPSFLIYSIFLLIPFFFKHTKFLFLNLFFTRTFYFCFSLLAFSVLFTFLNSSCLVFPISFTCFENLSWSIDKNTIKEASIWFELWSKGGANPNFIVGDRLEYISGFNWVDNWIKIYFFNKVSDFILGIFALSIITFLFFYKKIEFDLKNKKKYQLLYFILIFLIIEWFLKHPTLRYGGYHIIGLIIFIPLSMLLGKTKLNFKKYQKKVFIILFITLFIFSSRNIIRLNYEYEKYSYNLFTNSQFKFIGGNENFYFRYNNHIENHKKTYRVLNFANKKIILIHK
tara:strand:+ start:22541 stop:24169 length:1629 start_codon:yes stop_codon:yes gene_type:complete